MTQVTITIDEDIKQDLDYYRDKNQTYSDFIRDLLSSWGAYDFRNSEM